MAIWKEVLQRAYDKTSRALKVKGDIKLTSSKAEVESAQHTELATTVKEYALAEGAKQIEIYCETGAVRIRTDGEPCTATTGIPLAADYAAAFEVDSVSVYYVQESVITVVSR